MEGYLLLIDSVNKHNGVTGTQTHSYTHPLGIRKLQRLSSECRLVVLLTKPGEFLNFFLKNAEFPQVNKKMPHSFLSVIEIK